MSVYIIKKIGSNANATNLDTGAIEYSGTDASDIINDVLISIPSRSTMLIREGTYDITSPIIVPDKRLRISGMGSYITEFKAVSGFIGSTLLSINANPANIDSAISGFKLSGLTVNMDLARFKNAIEVNHLTTSTIRDIRINYGNIGLKIANCGDCNFESMSIGKQTTAGIQLNGDGGLDSDCVLPTPRIGWGGTEHYFSDIRIQSAPASDIGDIQQQAGFEYVRTTKCDTGGLYLHRVKINDHGNNMINGFKFHSSAQEDRTGIFTFINQCIADSIGKGDAFLLKNMKICQMQNSFFMCRNQAPEGSAGLHFHNTAGIKCNMIMLGSAGIESNLNQRTISITGPTDQVDIINCQLDGPGYKFWFDNSTNKSGIRAHSNRYAANYSNYPDIISHNVDG